MLDGVSLTGKRRYLLLSLLVVVLDQWTKWLVEAHLPLHGRWPLIDGMLDFTHLRNPGVAFGLLTELGLRGGWLLSLASGVALLAVLLYFSLLPASHAGTLAGLALTMGGAVGNLLDRVATGAVTDFVDAYLRLGDAFHHWPAFNLADSAITAGIVLMLVDAVRHRRHPPAPEAAEASGA